MAEKLAKLVQSLPNPMECTPDDYMTVLQDVCEELTLYHPRIIARVIEYEAINYQEGTVDEWLDFLHFFKMTLLNTSSELSFLLKLYQLIATEALTPERMLK